MEQKKIKIPVRKGTQAIYDALATKDAGIIYILTDVAEGNNIFLGDIPLGRGTGEIIATLQKLATAVQELEAPRDDKIYGRKNGQWVELHNLAPFLSVSQLTVIIPADGTPQTVNVNSNTGWTLS